jgi:hypothetical protein
LLDLYLHRRNLGVVFSEMPESISLSEECIAPKSKDTNHASAKRSLFAAFFILLLASHAFGPSSDRAVDSHLTALAPRRYSFIWNLCGQFYVIDWRTKALIHEIERSITRGTNMTDAFATAQVVSRQFPTMVAWFRPRVKPHGIYGEQSGTGQVFSEYFFVPCQSFTPPIAPKSSSCHPMRPGMWLIRPYLKM